MKNKNIKTKRIWTSGQMNYLAPADKYSVYFSPDKSKFVRQDGGIETSTCIFVMPDSPVEIRRIELKNLGNTEETIEVNSFIEPIKEFILFVVKTNINIKLIIIKMSLYFY